MIADKPSLCREHRLSDIADTEDDAAWADIEHAYGRLANSRLDLQYAIRFRNPTLIVRAVDGMRQALQALVANADYLRERRP